jgi:hypothetical protein
VGYKDQDIDFNKGLSDRNRKIVWDRFVDLTELAKKASTGQFSAVSASPSEQQVYVRPRIMADKEGNLVMVLPGNGEVKTFSPDGKLLKSYTLDTGERMQITQQDRADYSNRMKERAAASEKAINETTDQAMKERHRRTAVQMRELADIYLDPAKYPGHLPALSQAMLDSDGNLLIFLFTARRIRTGSMFMPTIRTEVRLVSPLLSRAITILTSVVRSSFFTMAM